MKDIIGYEGLYKITRDGNVFSTPSDGKKNRWLKQEVIRMNHTNYRRVTLSKNGKTKRCSVHRLVALAFIDNPYNKPQVNHIDSNGENNDYKNLEWVSGSENMKHSINAGRSDNMKINSTVKRIKKARNAMDSMIGSIHGKLTILSVLEYGTRGKYECICECGNKAIKRKDNLFHGQCKKCAFKGRMKI